MQSGWAQGSGAGLEGDERWKIKFPWVVACSVDFYCSPWDVRLRLRIHDDELIMTTKTDANPVLR